MAVKNIQKRTEILAVSYTLFSERPYDKVSLSDIARGAGINKSLLQSYYGQKIDLIKTLLSDLLSVSFSYMDGISYENDDLFQKISDFNMLFFKGVDNNLHLKQFIISSVSQPELLDTWIDTICSWLRQYCGEETFSYLQLKKAMCFAMGGSMHLYVHQDEFGIDYRQICRRHIRTILSFLDYQLQTTEAIIQKTDENIAMYEIGSYLSFCEKNIGWLEL